MKLIKVLTEEGIKEIKVNKIILEELNLQSLKERLTK